MTDSSFDAWTRRMRTLADGAGIVDHQFLQQLGPRSGPRAKNALKLWATQDYFVSRDFPCLLGAIISHIREPGPRHLMVKNLWEEHGEGSRRKTHHALFCRLMSSIGMPENLAESQMTAATRQFIEVQEEMARDNLFRGLGAFCYANEYITVDEFAPLEKAIEYEFPHADLSFFWANRQVDARHAAETEKVISCVVGSPRDLTLVEEGATRALNARVAVYDSLLIQDRGRS